MEVRMSGRMGRRRSRLPEVLHLLAGAQFLRATCVTAARHSATSAVVECRTRDRCPAALLIHPGVELPQRFDVACGSDGWRVGTYRWTSTSAGRPWRCMLWRPLEHPGRSMSVPHRGCGSRVASFRSSHLATGWPLNHAGALTSGKWIEGIGKK